MALAPLRMVCNLGSFSICQNETHTEEGFSMNLWTLIQFGHHFMALMIPIQLSTITVVVPLLFSVSIVEMVFTHGIWASMITVGLVVTIFKITIAKAKVAWYDI
jgi:hypothetical protein